MMTVTAEAVARAVEAAIPQLACALPADVEAALESARARECDARGACALETLCSNARLAREEGLPLCQDTGTVRVRLEIGPDVCAAGDVFSQVDAAIARAYAGAGLRASVVRDALFARANTGDNTPAFCRIVPVREPGCARLRVMLKGGGSDNACRVVMLPPSAGRAGVVREVLSLVREKAANACPPLTVGVGVGGTFDSVADLATEALWREIGVSAASPEAAVLEAELLEAVNALGIGAGAQGGAATALAVHVETAPCHIAALPVAIELGCCAMRRCTIDLSDAIGGTPSLAQTVLSSHGQSTGLSGSCGTRREGMPPMAKRLSLPLSKEEIGKLRVGDTCLLTGEMYTLRDAGHARLMEEIAGQAADSPLPYGLGGATIFYAGPTPASPEHPERPFGAVGPTTASRMDAYAPALYRAGVAATIGKGTRAAAVAEACAQTGGVYFTAIGGAAATLGACVEMAETIAYADLGTEALRRIRVKDFPVTVAIDVRGRVFSPAENDRG